MKTPAELLPHQAPMIFISDVRSFDIEKGILVAHSHIQESDVLYQKSLNGVPTYAALEYMAQAIGCFVGLYDLEQNPDKKPGVGFVLGSRKLQILKPVFLLDEDYIIKVSALFCDENLASFECIMYNEKTNDVFANAIINAYRPENIDTFMKDYT
ncbi:MAG: hypothetical protein IKS41_05215 [Alphaproteobacteria bacterium]|nr:hypothetical protein [Alphaproteobacteria bacterium]